jgi:hypothetical protein
MSNLKTRIQSLAEEFATNIIRALRTASIDELTGVTSGGGAARGPRAFSAPSAAAAATAGAPRKRGRLGRRSTADIGKVMERIVSLLQAHPEGLRAEQIRSELNCSPKELPRPLADALSSGQVSKTGQKRATTYFAGGGAPAGEGGNKGKGKARAGRRKRGA